MNRPYVVCHVLSAADGTLNGDFFDSEYVHDAEKEYARIRREYDCDVFIYGSTSIADTYSDGLMVIKGEPALCFEDNIADSDIGQYFAVVDPYGMVAYSESYVEKRGNPKAHYVSMLTGRVSREYLEYLRELGISYIFAGEDTFEPETAVKKLQKYFGAKRIMIAGGGTCDYTFTAAGLVDEVSIVIAPVIEPGTKTCSVFEKYGGEKAAPVDFRLVDVKRIVGDTIQILYRPAVIKDYD